MKVLHFYKTYYPDSFGGVEQTIFQLASGFSSFGIEATVLALTPTHTDREIKVNGHQVFRCRSNFKLASTDFSLSVFWRFKELLEEADIIHYHFPWPFMDLVHFVINHKKPSLVTYHSDIVKQKILLKLYKPLRNKFLESVDIIVATSPNYRVTSDVLQLYQDKVEVIPIGLNKGLYPEVSIDLSSHWKCILGEKFFLFIGVLRYYKGLNILLDALAIRDFPTVIIGSGPIEEELRAKATLLGLRNIIFLGQLPEDDKVVILNLSYALVFPSNLRSEAFGISLLEGAMFGKPMISSEIGTGTSFINIDQETGFVIAPSSPMELHLAMLFLWDNPKVALKMGLKASERFLKLFTANKMCQSYATLYHRLINNKLKN
jgi:rhamnosyl/mannosyltransferase